MSTTDEVMLKCAACGKSGDGLKTCHACKMVKYCGATCQKAHWPKHKKECKKRAAELFDAALFKEPPPRGECPICFLRLPPRGSRLRSVYQICCGKSLCDGCMYAIASEIETCPYCREEAIHSNKGIIKKIEKRCEAGDASAFNMLGGEYEDGGLGLARDPRKAVELYIRGGELGCEAAYNNVGCMYDTGQGVEQNLKKAIHYYQLAAMGGSEGARFNLGAFEAQAGKMTRAVRHWMIAAAAGHDDSLEAVKKGFLKGFVTKDEFEKALRAHKESQDAIKSDQREKAIKIRAVDNHMASLMGAEAWSKIGK